MQKSKSVMVVLGISICLTACGKEAENTTGKENFASVTQSTDTNVTDIATDTDVESGADTATGVETTEAEINLEELIPSQMPDRPLTYSQEEFEAVISVLPEERYESGDSSYVVTEWDTNQTQVGKPYGICATEESLYVCDFENNCIVKLDSDGNFIERYGTLGGEQGNFTRPSAITLYGDSLYVLDQGNNRVQVFDKEMNFQKEIPYTGVHFYFEEEYFSDIAIDQNGTVYLSSDSFDENQSYVYYITENGELEKVKPCMTGYLAEYNGETYALNTFFFCRAHMGLVKLTGQNFLFKCNTEHLEQLAQLPYAYTPADFCILNDMLYTVSIQDLKSVQFNRITMEGELDSVIQIIEFEDRVFYEPWYMEVVDDNLIYATDTFGGSIYKIQKQGE